MAQLTRPGGGAIALLLLWACSPTAPPAPPPPEVTVINARPRTIENIVEVPGRVQAVRTAQVRARVDGIVQKRLYEEGTDVEEGQQLFVIDPRQLQAQVNAVAASLVRAQAAAANAAQDVNRYQGLIEDQAVSQQEYDAAVARLRTAQADVAQMRAQLQSAQLNLSYTTVTAPIAGRAGRAEVTEGALVSAAAATLLTTIEQLDPIYVNFSQSSGYLLALRQEVAAGRLQAPALGHAAVTLILEDGSTYAHTGRVHFLDLAIDPQTGTAAVRAQFPNPQRLLLPGQFVRALLQGGTRHQAYLLPQRAVQLAPTGASVMVVNPDYTVTSRQVTLGNQDGSNWVITSGLKPGEQVIIEGLQRVRPGSPVRIAGEPAHAGSKASAPPRR